ncbi:MAG: NADH-quinone oxidoreductase subunit J [Phycisphaerales bacterium]|nr:NADH-quinone oxidoreductase subunit J [Phycisphaerales bacterium]
MDYALLAATALGAIGLYLMLPRERAPLARLGGLLATLAIAGFFLYLVRTVNLGATVFEIEQNGKPVLSGTPVGPPVYFYLFAFVMIAGTVGVVCQSRPVYAALYFVLVTLAGAGIFVLLMAEFMAVVLIIIYAGAILVTYVFVIMLANQGGAGEGGETRSPGYDRFASEPFIAVLVSFVLVGAILQVLYPVHGRQIAVAAHPDPLMARNLSEVPTTSPIIPSPSNVQVLGADLYSHYLFPLELAGVILTIALIGAVVIARKNTELQPLGSGKLPSG